ncbi:hypothetical protein CGRA01v4_01581 [Colletotrichum graminicola]|nr:hypothetical protein CGRA01v4_01581 [Colletotrichum graminicola]
MAPSPSDDGSVSVANAPSRIVARQACDGCRSRKRRCTFKGDDAIHWANAGQASDVATRCQNSLTFHQTGNTNLWRMLEVESMQLLRLLEVQNSSSYIGLDAIETQLRKKAFWLMFYAYIHHTHSYRHERVTFLDPVILQEINLEELMPVPVDDEFISCAGILPCPEDISAKSMTAGFNIHSRIFSAARLQSPLCSCPQARDPTIRLARLKEQLCHLKYMLDTVQPAYKPWKKSKSALTPASDDDSVRIIQRDIIRANIQTTHLWLQIVLLGQIDNIISEQSVSASPPKDPAPHVAFGFLPPPFSQRQGQDAVCDERENICRELLHTVHSFSRSALEPNGNGLVYKLRDIAVALLPFSYEVHEERSLRVREYLAELSELLSILDVSEIVNTLSLQSWVDTSRNRTTDSPSTKQ